MDVVLTDQTIALLKYVAHTPSPSGKLIRELGLSSGNAHNLIMRLWERGFLDYQEVEPESRAGMRRGELQRQWCVTKLGRTAIDLHTAVNQAIAENG